MLKGDDIVQLNYKAIEVGASGLVEIEGILHGKI